MAKFYLVCSCWASSSKTHERNNTRDICACVYSPVPENGNGEIKTKREYVRNGPFHSSPVQLPFNTCLPPVFFKRAPVVRIERGNFFFTPTVYMDIRRHGCIDVTRRACFDCNHSGVKDTPKQVNVQHSTSLSLIVGIACSWNSLATRFLGLRLYINGVEWCHMLLS